MAKLTELFDPIGWAISADGNKTRVRKSFYMKHKDRYRSLWFPKEADATRFFNDKVLQGRKPEYVPSLTLYEAVKDAKVGFATKMEGKLRDLMFKAYETKVLDADVYAQYVEPVLEIQGERARKAFLDILEKYDIKIVNKKDLKEQLVNEIGPCKECGKLAWTSGLGSKEKDMKFNGWSYKKMSKQQRRDYLKHFEWVHKCLSCGNTVYTGKPLTGFDEEMDGHGAMMVQEEVSPEPPLKDDDNRVRFHFDEDMYPQPGDYSADEPSDYKEQQQLDNLISYYMNTLGKNKDKIKAAIERSKNPLKQKLLFHLEKMNKDLFEMSVVGGIAGSNAPFGGEDNVTVDNKNVRHRKTKLKAGKNPIV